MGDEFEYEQTLCQIPTVHVFKIPARTNVAGHRASDWTEEVWEGKLSVIQKGKICTIFLIDRATNAEFARAPVDEGAVERATDSSRYYVLRCVNQNTKQKAFIGLAFNERNDAFEFNVALQDFEKYKKQQVSFSVYKFSCCCCCFFFIQPSKIVLYNFDSFYLILIF